MNTAKTLLAVSLTALLTPACMMASPGLAGTASMRSSGDAWAKSAGYPTKKTQADLDHAIAQQTKDFTRDAQLAPGSLEAPTPITINGVRGTCYTVVMHLADGASWGPGANAGLRFDFQTPKGPGSGGPGLIGPGAVASVGCAEADGPITLTMAPLVGHDPIGKGSYAAELWHHTLSAKEAQHLKDDQKRQEQDFQAFEARQKAQQDSRASAGCGKCNARYQGCVGAGRTQSSCSTDYRSCAFEEVGADYTSSCPYPK